MREICTAMRRVLLACLVLLAGACAAPPPAPLDAAGQEASRLRATMLAEVPGAATPDNALAARWVALAQSEMARAGRRPAGAELALLADRAPAVQRVALLLMREDGPWEVVAIAPASTGITGVRGHFVTPLGVYAQDGSIRGYRALGTYNREGIRGLGERGMRVWDFGWYWAQRGWVDEPSEARIRFALHATDPDLHEPLLGAPASEGCVRVSGAMNRFLDVNGVLDADVARIAETDRRFAALLLAERRVTPLAGRSLIVVDGSTP
jgi:hypothetical protein